MIAVSDLTTFTAITIHSSLGRVGRIFKKEKEKKTLKKIEHDHVK